MDPEKPTLEVAETDHDQPADEDLGWVVSEDDIVVEQSEEPTPAVE